MENVRKSSQQYGALDKTELQRGMEKPREFILQNLIIITAIVKRFGFVILINALNLNLG